MHILLLFGRLSKLDRMVQGGIFEFWQRLELELDGRIWVTTAAGLANSLSPGRSTV